MARYQNYLSFAKYMDFTRREIQNKEFCKQQNVVVTCFVLIFAETSNFGFSFKLSQKF